jgi:hypothetical protein
MEVTEPLQETPGSIGVLTGLRANGITEVVRTICTCAVAGDAAGGVLVCACFVVI